jgi:hypothetical protein
MKLKIISFKDLNVNPDIIKLKETKNIRGKLLISLSNAFLHKTPKAQTTSTKIDKLDSINYETSAQQRNNRLKRRPTLERL